VRARAALLRTVEQTLQRPALILEKDIWVCWALRTLFRLPDAPRMAFKGGTSLSKVYRAIDRFSEDIDVTIDYRSILPDFDPFSKAMSNSKRKQTCLELQDKVREMVRDRIAPFFKARLDKEAKGQGNVEIVEGDEALRVTYRSALTDIATSSYMESSVLVEFGGRNTTEPMQKHIVQPYVVGHTIDVFFPTAEVPVLAAERTFWEKATLIHVECNRDDFEARVGRKSRHWYDLAKLADHEIGRKALGDRNLLADVVRHKEVFYSSGQARYGDCLKGGLKLLPEEKSRKALAADYKAMRDGGMFEQEPPRVDAILNRLDVFQNQINDMHRDK
jgi:predicted nucleotidyltransferase component of viral defense system